MWLDDKSDVFKKILSLCLILTDRELSSLIDKSVVSSHDAKFDRSSNLKIKMKLSCS